MVLDPQTTEKIKELVYKKPRSIHELAIAIDKSWRTTSRYIEEIMLKTGTIKTETFRGGTRGALRIVYWNNTEKVHSSDVQENLFKQIELGIDKQDFSPFEIYQYVEPSKRKGSYEIIENEKKYNYDIASLVPYFEKAEKEILIFAGNLAFIHLRHKKKIIDYLRDCVKRKVVVKIITNINLIDLKNVEETLSLNSGLKDPLIIIKHAITPLRAYLFDEFIIKFGEIQKGFGKEGQIDKAIAIYYAITDKEWIEWMQKIFWKKFQASIPANKRIENLDTLKKVRTKKL
jgi:hypothetical protein